MALNVGQNSWCTVPEADTYLTEKIESEVWFELSSVGTPGQTSKQSLLISAFYWLYLAPGFSKSISTVWRETTSKSLVASPRRGKLSWIGSMLLLSPMLTMFGPSTSGPPTETWFASSVLLFR